MTNKRFKIITFLTGATPSRGLLTLPLPPTNSLKVVSICEIWSSINSLEMTTYIHNPLIIIYDQSGTEGKIVIFRLKMHFFFHFNFWGKWSFLSQLSYLVQQYQISQIVTALDSYWWPKKSHWQRRKSKFAQPEQT